MASTPSTSPRADQQRDPRARRATRLVLGALLIAALLTGAYFLATSSFLTRWIVTSRLASMLGGQVTARSVTITPGGRVTILDGVVRAPGITGIAGEVFRVDRLEALIDIPSTFTASPRLYAVTLDGPVARISRGVEDGRVNLAALAPGLSPGGSMPRLPEVYVWDGLIEVGEHGSRLADRYSVLKQLRVAGRVEQSASEDGASIISFRQSTGDASSDAAASPSPDAPAGQDSGPLADGLLVSGRVSRTGVSVTLTGLDLGSVTPENTPAEARELFRRAALEGRVPEAVVTYDFAGTWSARILLHDVALNLPVEAQPDEDSDGNPIPVPQRDQGAQLRMERTSGTVILSNEGMEGSLRGMLEALPYEVTFEVMGTSPDSPWECTLLARNVQIQGQAQALKFAPGLVRRRLREFSNPTGLVDARVTIARDAPPSPGAPQPPVRVRGELQLRDVTAAFFKFPYLFKKLTGRVTFSDEEIRIENLRGIADSGAVITASGTIAPPSDDAQVDLAIRTINIPVDDALRRAMAARAQGDVLEEIFSQGQFDRLLAAGLIKREGDAPPASNPEAPAFTLGGHVNVDVAIRRERGYEGIWNDVVSIDIPRAGVLPDALPYPLIATNVTIVQRDGVATVSGGEYRGLRGGRVSLRAVADFEKLALSDDFLPDVDATGEDIPADDLLLFALPAIRAAAPASASGAADLEESGSSVPALIDEEGRTPLRAWLTPLHPTGLVSGSAMLRSAADGEPLYRVDSTFTGRLQPRAPDGSRRVVAEQANVRTLVTQSHVSVALAATLASPQGSAPVTLELHTRTGDVPPQEGDPEPITPVRDTVVVRAESLPLALPVDDFVRVVAPAAAEQIAGVRADFSPTGSARVEARVPLGTQAPAEAGLAQPAPPSKLVTLDRFQSASLHLHAPASADAPAPQPAGALALLEGGTVTIEVPDDAPPLLRLDASVELRNPDNTAQGTIALAGALPLRQQAGEALPESPAPAGALQNPPALTLAARSLALDSPALHEALARAGQRGVRDALTRLRVGGLLDADLRIATQEDSPAGERSVTGVLTPRTLSLTTASGARASWEDIRGRAVLTPLGGNLEALELLAPQWSLRLDGGWRTTGNGPTRLDARLTLSAEKLTEDLRVVLPPVLRESLDALSLHIDGPLALIDAPLLASISREGELTQLSSSGVIAFEGARADLGLTLTDASGIVEYDLRQGDAPADTPAGANSAANPQRSFSLQGQLNALRAGGVTLTDARITVASSEDGSGVVTPTFTASSHGGRVSGIVTLTPQPAPAPASAASPTERTSIWRYDLSLETSNVRFAPVLEELVTRNTPRRGPLLPDDTAPDGSRGVLSGSVTMSGVTQDPASRRGRGTLSVRGGNVLSLPLLVPLVRVTNLQLPTQERLDYAFADFFLQGPVVSFEQLAVSSESVGLYGVGTATWPDLTLDLRLRTGNRSRIPVLTPVVETLRGELLTTTVRGTIDDPRVEMVRFAGTRETFDTILGADPRTPEQRRLDAMEQGVPASERRERPEDMPAVPPAQPPASPR